MNTSYVETIAEQLPVLCSLNLQCWARLRTVCSMVRNVNIPMAKAIRVDCIHKKFWLYEPSLDEYETSWLYEPPLDEYEELFPEYSQTERRLHISVVHVPKAYLEGAASKHLSVPVQCTSDGNTCWYRLVVISLGGRWCMQTPCQPPRPYGKLLQAVYIYGSSYIEGLLNPIYTDEQNELPHIFCMLSPRCEAIDLEFEQFQSMVAADCDHLQDGEMFRVLGEAIRGAKPFPLRMQEQYRMHGMGDLSPCQNVGLSTTEMQYIEEEMRNGKA